MRVSIDAIYGSDGRAPSWQEAETYCRQLESAHILFFPLTPFELPEGDCCFLRAQERAVAATHKNVVYQPAENRVAGLRTRDAATRERLRDVLRTYSQRVTRLVTTLLAPYAEALRVDYASFRGEEEEGRRLQQRSRNDLLHTDAFPSRPTNGDRILRVFTNIHPTRPRRWVTTERFDRLLETLVDTPGLPLPGARRWSWRTRRACTALASAAGLPSARRSLYDDFMLRFHDFLKGNGEFQIACVKQIWDFPSRSTWMALTDALPHAALSGQHALEQTFIVGREAMLLPETAPINVLERLCGVTLSDPAPG